MRRFVVMYNNSGNPMDTLIPMGVTYADTHEEAQEKARAMFGPTAWAEEVGDIDKKAC